MVVKNAKLFLDGIAPQFVMKYAKMDELLVRNSVMLDRKKAAKMIV